MDNFTPATESILRKRTLDNVLDTYLKQLDKKLRTKEDCDAFISKIKADQAKFNTALKALMDSKIKHDKGTIDDKQFKELTRTAYKDINQYCKTFKVKMSDFGGGGFDAKSNITKEDIIDFKQYVTKLIAGVNLIKKRRIALAKEMNSKVGEKSTFSKDMKNIDKQTENLTKSNASEDVGVDEYDIENLATEDSIRDKETLNTINTILRTIREEAQPGLKEISKKYKCPFYVRWKMNKIYEEIKKLGYKIFNKHSLTWVIANIEAPDSSTGSAWKDNKEKLENVNKEAIKLFDKVIDDVHEKINMNDKVIRSNNKWQVYLYTSKWLTTSGSKYFKVEIKIEIPKENTKNVESKTTESGLSFEEIFNVAMESLESEGDNYDVSTEATDLGQTNIHD